MMRLSHFTDTKTSRATSWLLTFALLLTLVPTFTLVAPKPALAADAITNGAFPSSLANWTTVQSGSGSTAHDPAVGNAAAGSARQQTTVGKWLDYDSEATQTVGFISSNATVTLSLWLQKASVDNPLNGWFNNYVRIRKPSGATADIWTNTDMPGTDASITRTANNADVASFFDETGTYEIRLVSDLRSGSKNSSQARVWWDDVVLDVQEPPAGMTTVGNGTDPASKNVAPGDSSQTVDSFTLQTNTGTDTVTSISVAGSGETTSGSVSLAKLYADNNSDGLLDAGDTVLGTGTFSASTATISSLSINVSSTIAYYVIAYDITAGAPDGASLSGTVGDITAVNPVTYSDSSSAALTVDAVAPGTVTQFLASDGLDERVPISWTNPTGDATFTVRVLRRTDQFPTSATDTVATNIYDATETSGATANIVDTGLTNNQTYYYAAFTKDPVGNWNNTVTADVTANTATPNSIRVGDSAAAVSSATVKESDLNQEIGAFILRATGGSDTVSTMTVTGSADTTSGNVSAVRLFSDAGTLGVLDVGDTTIASTTFSGNLATFTGLGLNVDTNTADYLLTYDIAANPADGAQLTGYISSATASSYEVLTSTDTIDATLTVDSQAPGTATGFTASDEDQQSNLSWSNPGDADLDEVIVLRKTGSFSADHTDGTMVLDDTNTPFDTGYLDTGLTNGLTYFYAVFTKDTIGHWNDTVTAGTTADTATPSGATPQTTTIDDGSPGFGDSTVGPSYVNQAVDVFTLATNSGTDTVSAITVTGGGDTGSTNVSAARLFSDAGTIGVLDAGDTTIAASTFSGSTVTFGSLNLSVDITASNYLVAYSISAGASHNAKLDGYVSTVTASAGNDMVMQDTIDATLTVDAQAPGSATGFDATDFGDTTSNLTWVNPGDADLAEIKVVRKTGSYPTAHTDGTTVVDDTVSPFDTGFNDSSLTNGTKYYYAAFAQDSHGNWNSAVVEGTNADTATPQALAVTFGNNAQNASGNTFYHGQIDRLMQSFTLATNGASGSWTQIGLSESGSGTATNNVAQVKIFRDDGDLSFDPGDTELTTSPNTFSGENTTFTITGGEPLTSAEQGYFIVYDITDNGSSETSVTVASQLTADGSIIVTNAPVSGINPTKSSGTATLLPDTVTAVGFDTAPLSTVFQNTTNDFLRLALTTNFGTANWTSVTVDRTGTATDSDVSAVKIYKSPNPTWETYDTQIGSGTFSSGSSTIDITDQAISTAISYYYFVVYTISETADASNTVGARVDSGGTITLAPPDGISSFSFSSSVPAIEAIQSGSITPTAPTNLTATSTVPSQVLLNWTAAEDSASGIANYKIYRAYESFDSTSYEASATPIATIDATTSYTDTTATGLITGEDYWYAVSAINGEGVEGPISNVATVTVSGKSEPHYDFSTTTTKCRVCHKLHNSPARTKVFRKFPEIQICFTCHDGTGSDYNIQQKWTDSAHNGTETALYSSGTFIQCVKCHNPHGTDPDYGTPYFLQRRVEENLCFRCHSSTGFTPVATKNGRYIEDQMTSSVTVSRHAVVSTTTKNGQGYYPEGTATTADGLTGARVECTNCHNAMVSQRGTLGTSFLVRLIDPFNVWNLWQDNSRSVEATFVNFCLNCHNSSATPIKIASATTIVPYTVAFPSMSTTDYPFFFGWDKVAYRDSTSAHNVNAVICGNCHAPHGSRNSRLMAFGYDADTSTDSWDYYYDDSAAVSNEENLCYQCHRAAGRAGYTSAPDIMAQFAKTYKMPVATNGRHKDTEQPSAFNDGNRHSECYDCHDPHLAKSGMRGKNNLAGGPINGAIGISVVNTAKDTTPTFSVKRGVTYEYELCFKCHSGYVDLANDSTNSMQYGDKAFEFNPLNSSFMPVETTGHNDSSNLDTQLQAGMDTDSIISCTDCHNNDTASNANGWVVNSSTTSTTEAIGPHGSSNHRILRGNYDVSWLHPGDDNYSWDSNNFELCFLCHNVTAFSDNANTNTNFYQPSGVGNQRGNLHEVHLVNRVGKSSARCKNCHWNPHGNGEVQPDNTIYRILSSTSAASWDFDGVTPQTDLLKTTRLINFSPDVQDEPGTGKPIWRYDLNNDQRACSVNCHGSGSAIMTFGATLYEPSSGDATP